MLIALLKLIRLKQWVKNVFILAPVFFGGRLLNIHILKEALLAIIAFSFVASAVYIINDWCDIEKDKKHPVKSLRPLVSGKISKTTALIALVVLLLIGTSVMYSLSFSAFIVVLVYFLINLLYSFILKHIAIIDISIIALGFVLRIVIGGIIFNIPLSNWIIIMTFLLAIFLAIAKRRDDLLLLKNDNILARKSI